jgi:hypothetical protein
MQVVCGSDLVLSPPVTPSRDFLFLHLPHCGELEGGKAVPGLLTGLALPPQPLPWREICSMRPALKQPPADLDYGRKEGMKSINERGILIWSF